MQNFLGAKSVTYNIDFLKCSSVTNEVKVIVAKNDALDW